MTDQITLNLGYSIIVPLELYLRFVVELPEGEPVEMFVPELPGTKRPYGYDIKSHPVNLTYDTGGMTISTWKPEPERMSESD